MDAVFTDIKCPLRIGKSRNDRVCDNTVTRCWVWDCNMTIVKRNWACCCQTSLLLAVLKGLCVLHVWNIHRIWVSRFRFSRVFVTLFARVMVHISISALLIKYDTRDILRATATLNVRHTDVIAVRLPTAFSPFVVRRSLGKIKITQTGWNVNVKII